VEVQGVVDAFSVTEAPQPLVILKLIMYVHFPTNGLIFTELSFIKLF